MRYVLAASVFAAFIWAGTAHAAARTSVKLFVSAGGPVAGAAISVDGESLGRSDARGYAVLSLEPKTNGIHVVATGGRVGRTAVRGSLEAIVPSAARRNSIDVNPVSTVVAAYITARPATAEQIARERVRALLGIAPNQNLERALRGRPRYFDGLRFLRYANAHGGVGAYARALALRIDRRHGEVHFIRPELDVGVGGGLSALQVFQYAGSALSFISGTFSIVNDIIGWTRAPQPSNGQIYTAVQQIQSQLGQIQDQLNSISSEIQDDFTTLKSELDQTAYSNAVLPVNTLAGQVQSAVEDYQDLLTNATSPNFSKTVAKQDKAALEDLITTIQSSTNSANDVFSDAVADGQGSAYYFLANVLQDANLQWLNPAISLQLDHFRSFVLYYQALAFGVQTSWFSSGHTNESVSDVPQLEDAVTEYLGPDTDWQAWVTANPPGASPTAPPAAGALHDEITFLQTISDVPAGTVISPGGLMLSDTTTGPQNDGAFSELEVSDYFPSVLTCSDYAYSGVSSAAPGYTPYADGTFPVCKDVWTGFQHARNDVLASAAAMQQATGLSGWAPATPAQLGSLGDGPPITGPGDAPFAALWFWDGSMYCPSTGEEAQGTCTSLDDYSLYYLDWGAYDQFQMLYSFDLQIFNAGIWTGTGAATTTYVTSLTADVADPTQVGGVPTLFVLPARQPASGEKYRP